MQSRNFRLQKVGDLDWLEKNYKFQKISFSLDEIVILNATRVEKSINEFAMAVSRLVEDVFIPVAAGGGIRSADDARLLFSSGADKLVVNSILAEAPGLVRDLVKTYGSQSIIASIDYKSRNGANLVCINDGARELEMPLGKYIEHVQSLDIGEIYLNSMDRDGTGFGYDFETIGEIVDAVRLPLIIAGGAGNESHLIDGLHMGGVSAVATANLFNFIGDGLPKARNKIIESGENVAKWNKSF